jgi:DNA-binding transcriptional regulator YiaG
MGKLEAIIKSEIVRLAKMELRKIFVPLRRDVWQLKSVVSQIRKSVSSLERSAADRQKELGKREVLLEASPEEVKISRFSPRLFRSLRKRLGITQRELAILCGVTLGAVQSWESGKFRPKDEKRRTLVSLKKLRRRDVKKLLGQKIAASAGK